MLSEVAPEAERMEDKHSHHPSRLLTYVRPLGGPASPCSFATQRRPRALRITM